MPNPPTDQELQLLARDALRAFEHFDYGPPDVVQFNRNGDSDINIRGIWSFRDLAEFYHVAQLPLDPNGPENIPTSPESSGRTD